MSKREHSRVGVAVVALALLGCSLARAGDGAVAGEGAPAPGAPLEEPRLPGMGPLTRLGRGIANIVLSPLEVPATMVRVAGEHNAFFGIWAGGLEGVGNGLVRFSAGALEALTFPVPSDGLPLYAKRLGQRALPPNRLPTDVTRQ